MRAIILGAGQGRRLLPLTASKPKALLAVGERELLAWQIDALVQSGVRDITFVAGFNAPVVHRVLEGLQQMFPGCRLRMLFNPFFRVADNLVSCWLAREAMAEDFVLLNGDTLFEPDLCTTLLRSPFAPVTVAIDQKPAYDPDDMKVELAGTRLVDVGKGLAPERVHGESIGMILFRGDGGAAFAAALEQAMQDEAALRMWYLSVIARLAGTMDVETCLIAGHDWCEVDYPADLERAEAMVAAWYPELARRPAV